MPFVCTKPQVRPTLPFSYLTDTSYQAMDKVKELSVLLVNNVISQWMQDQMLRCFVWKEDLDHSKDHFRKDYQVIVSPRSCQMTKQSVSPSHSKNWWKTHIAENVSFNT